MADRTPFEIEDRIHTGNFRYFKAGNGKRAGQWACADWSGTHPWSTTDGVRWVARAPIEAGDSEAALTLVEDTAEGPKSSRVVIGLADTLIIASRLNLSITIRGQHPFTVRQSNR